MEISWLPSAAFRRAQVRDGVPVKQGMKAVEVVPAGAKVFGVGERPARIAAYGNGQEAVAFSVGELGCLSG